MPMQIAIVVALEEERDSLLALLGDYQKLDKDGRDPNTYYVASVRTSRRDAITYKVVLLCLSEMGPLDAATRTSALVRRWRVRHVLLVGIAGGVSGVTKLGDVVVAMQVADYTLGKVFEDGRREVRWQAHSCDANWLDSARNLSQGWANRIKAKPPRRTEPQRHLGVVASGGDVVAFPDLVAAYRKNWPKLVAVEMEAAGVAAAVHSSIERPSFIMIKGVSDLADGSDNAKKKRRWRAFAADAAAAYAVELIRRGPVADGDDESLGPGGLPDVPASYDRVFYSIAPVTAHLEEMILSEIAKVGRAQVKNLGLDAEVTLAWLNYAIFQRADVHDISFRCLVVDPQAEAVKEFIDGESNIQSRCVAQAIAAVARSASNTELHARRVVATMRLYGVLPAIHGFLINGRYLYLGYTEFEDDKLFGAKFPYWFFDAAAPTRGGTKERAHLVRFFDSWFEYLWSQGIDPHAAPLPPLGGPLVIGHRGAAGHADENTLESIAVAIELGVDIVEIDVQVTSDGVPVLMHDKDVDRTTNGTGSIGSLEWAAVDALATSSGCKVPSLAAACMAVAPARCRLMLEIVAFELAEYIVETALRYLPRERVIIASFDHRILMHMKSRFSGVLTAALLEGIPCNFREALLYSHCDIVALGADSVTAEQIAVAREVGVEAYAWTVNGERAIERVCALGVGGVISDYPDRVKQVVRRRS